MLASFCVHSLLICAALGTKVCILCTTNTLPQPCDSFTAEKLLLWISCPGPCLFDSRFRRVSKEHFLSKSLNFHSLTITHLFLVSGNMGLHSQNAYIFH